jgi:hypothetical protein
VAGDEGEARRWSLAAARELLPDVRERTGKAVPEVEALLAERARLPAEDPARAEVEVRLRQRIAAWARSMEALGVEVKGLWLVDFDNGSGYFCWKWPETGLDWFHGYDDGFAGRTRIQ